MIAGRRAGRRGRRGRLASDADTIRRHVAAQRGSVLT